MNCKGKDKGDVQHAMWPAGQGWALLSAPSPVVEEEQPSVLRPGAGSALREPLAVEGGNK